MKLTESHLRQMIRQELKKAMGLNEDDATKKKEAERRAALTTAERQKEDRERRERREKEEEEEERINMIHYGSRDGNRYVR